MYHSEAQLLKIERWARSLSWYYLVAIIPATIIGIYNSVKVWQNLEIIEWVPESYHLGIRVLEVLKNAHSVLSGAFIFIILLAVSRIIRYLLAVKIRILSGTNLG
ncbi:MAG: hypothetical protein JW726_06195 [Anaerolineales bacterium]|nr:hypothetical protein [Anaerolineales bacterium]